MQRGHPRNVCGLKHKVAKFRNFVYVCINKISIYWNISKQYF